MPNADAKHLCWSQRSSSRRVFALGIWCDGSVFNIVWRWSSLPASQRDSGGRALGIQVVGHGRSYGSHQDILREVEFKVAVQLVFVLKLVGSVLVAPPP